MSVAPEIKPDKPFSLDELLESMRVSFEADRVLAGYVITDKQRATASDKSIATLVLKASQLSREAEGIRLNASGRAPDGQLFRLVLAAGDTIIRLETEQDKFGWRTSELRHPVTEELDGLVVAGHHLSRGHRLVNHGHPPLGYLKLRDPANKQMLYVGFGEEAMGGLDSRLSVVSGLAVAAVTEPVEQITEWLAAKPRPEAIPSGIR